MIWGYPYVKKPPAVDLSSITSGHFTTNPGLPDLCLQAGFGKCRSNLASRPSESMATKSAVSREKIADKI